MMTKLRDVNLVDIESQRRWRHSPAVVEFMYVLALKKCPVETEGFSKLNVYRSDREQVEKPFDGVVDVHLKFDIEDFQGEHANSFGLEQIDRAMQALERAGYVRKGEQRRVRDEVLRSNFVWSDPMTKWIRNGSGDAFRVIVSTANNGTQLDAEVRFADGERGQMPLLKSWWSPEYLTGALRSAAWKSSRSIELRLDNHKDASYKIQWYGLRFLDSRGMKDLEAEIATGKSVTFGYSLDRIRPPVVKQKSAKSAKKK